MTPARYPTTSAGGWPVRDRARAAFAWLTESPPLGIETNASTLDLLVLEALAGTGPMADAVQDNAEEGHEIIETIVSRYDR